MLRREPSANLSRSFLVEEGPPLRGKAFAQRLLRYFITPSVAVLALADRVEGRFQLSILRGE